MKLNLFLFCSLVLPICSLVAMNSIQDCQRVLDTKDCKQIFQAYKPFFLEKVNGIVPHLEFTWDGLQIIGPNKGTFLYDCFDLLRNFIIRDIMHPVIFADADLNNALEGIDALVSEDGIYKLNSMGDGIFGRYGDGNGNYEANVLKFALCHRRGVNPMSYEGTRAMTGLTPLYGLDNYVIPYVTAYCKEDHLLRGKAPLRIRIQSNKRLLCIVGLGVSCLLLYAAYQAWHRADTSDTPDQDEHDNEKVIAQPQA